VYRNNGVRLNAATPDQDVLTGASGGVSNLARYDQVLLPCEGGRTEESGSALANFLDYTSRGGRVFATHFSYTWLYKNGGFASAAQWNVDQMLPVSPITANIEMATRGGADFATWLQSIGALSNISPPQVSISDARRNIDAVPPSGGGQRWIYADLPTALHTTHTVLHMSIDTPVLATPDLLCGRVVYSDFHGTDVMNSAVTFPAECTEGGFTAQEKILQFMMLNLSGCIGPMRPGKGKPPIPPPPLPPGG
jgi:hypothetical protein